MWKSLSTLLGHDHNVTGAIGHTADGFAAFFAQPPQSVIDTAHSLLPSFRPCSQAEVRRIMSSPA